MRRLRPLAALLVAGAALSAPSPAAGVLVLQVAPASYTTERGADGGGLDAEEEYLLRSPSYVMEMPQSQERIRGRDAMRAMQRAFPTPPRSLAIRRVLGAQKVWVLEGELDYGEGPWHVCLVMELDDDGLIVRETRYYAERSAAPEWRAEWVEPLD